MLQNRRQMYKAPYVKNIQLFVPQWVCAMEMNNIVDLSKLQANMDAVLTSGMNEGTKVCL